jgi:hypothetical protein
MVAANVYDSRPSDGLADRIRQYFDRHPEVSREEFLLDALDREIDQREQGEADGAGRPSTDGLSADRGEALWPRWSEADVRGHAWLNQRMAVLRRERRGWWQRLRRLLSGGRGHKG